MHKPRTVGSRLVEQLMDQNTKLRIAVAIICLYYQEITAILLFYLAYLRLKRVRRDQPRRTNDRTWSIIGRMPDQFKHIRKLTLTSDNTCINLLRMDRNCFARLCEVLEAVGGLKTQKFVSIPEQVAILLSILAHHQKNVVVRESFSRSGHTISKYFKKALHAMLRLSNILLVQPEPVPETCSDERWRYFKGCLGALDGTHVDVIVRATDKKKYTNRKGKVTVNVLGACDRNKNFTYFMTGWEGSAADSRVLRAALARRNGIRVPTGTYYLCDAGYTNCEGFLAPYRATRYHLDEWNHARGVPQSAKELFNLRHCKARNVIECAFGMLKSRWAVLRSNTYYPIHIQNMIILNCALLHNFIRLNMRHDPLEADIDEYNSDRHHEDEEVEVVGSIDGSTEWNAFRDRMAGNMFEEWQAQRSCRRQR